MGVWDNIDMGHYNEAPTDAQNIKDMGINPDQGRGNPKMRSAEVMRRFRRVKAWWHEARTLHADNRKRRLKDHDCYEGDSWDQMDALILESRGQKKVNINRIKPAIDWIKGTQRRMRIDYRVLPRQQDDAKNAEIKTKIMKYYSDVNHEPYHRSQAFSDAIISGLGWLELGVRDDPEDEPIYYRYEDWINIWEDKYSVELDYSDARYLFRRRKTDLDIAVAMFPDHASDLIAAAAKAGEIASYDEIIMDDDTDVGGEDEELADQTRSRVTLVECWYIQPERRTILTGEDIGTLSGRVYQKDNEYMAQLVESGYASTFDAVKKTVRCMIFAEGMDHPLQDQESVYAHNRIPFIPVWGYRRKRSGESYGVTRNIIDIQDDINKRWSKSLYLLSTNRIIADDDATDNWDELYLQANRPDGVVRKKRGAEVRIETNANLAQGHIELMSLDAKLIQEGTGVTDENMGRQTNATSGRAIQARQEQGNTVTSELYDNLRLAIQLAGEMELSLIEQFCPEERTFRIVGERGQTEFVTVNRETPDEDGELNDITARKADFVVDQQTFNASIRQSMFDSLIELVKIVPPEIAIHLLDLIFDLSDLPGKDVYVERIRALTGETDPDENVEDESPEKQAQAQQAAAQEAEMAQLIQELELRMAMAKTEKAEAEADKAAAETAKIEAEAKYVKDKGTVERAKVLSNIENRRIAE